jgi:DNA-binding transcriptional LysR family regulator
VRKRFPNLKLTLREGYPADFEALLLKEELDLAVTTIEKKPAPGLHSLALVELPLVLLVEKASPVTAASQLWQRDRIEEALVCLPAAEAMCKSFQQGLARLGVDWFPGIEVSSVDLIETYVASGFGIGLSVQVPFAKVSPKVRSLPLPDFAPVVLGALWRGKTTALVQVFLDEIRLRAKRFLASVQA